MVAGRAGHPRYIPSVLARANYKFQASLFLDNSGSIAQGCQQ